jgi:spore maturation protein CgeB
VTNSKGVEQELLEMGARRAETLYFGADPDLFQPQEAEPDIDLFFYGFGSERREEELERLVTEPSRALPSARFVVAGERLDVDLGRAERVGPLTPSALRRYAARSRINLHVSRRPHAEVHGSSCMRIFELAAMGCCMASNRLAGMEEWLEPEREVFQAEPGEEVALYEKLLADGELRAAAGRAARERVLAEHTYRHRADELVRFLSTR